VRPLLIAGLACLCLSNQPLAGRNQTGSVAFAWKPLAAGVEYAASRLPAAPSPGDGVLHVVRIDPRSATLDLGLASLDGQTRTAGAWAEQKGFVAAINAGMYQEDFRSNVGFLRHGEHANNSHWNSYQSVLAIGPMDQVLPGAMILDRDAPGFGEQSARYRTLVQNLRLVKGPGVSVWQSNARRWSEAAIAMDREGRILFLFTRTPYEMADFNRRLLALPLGIVRAMHVEGGAEASLSVRAPGLKLDLAGSFETTFGENDGNGAQWALPNVIGVRGRR
jgi:phosphodiester glycosidase